MIEAIKNKFIKFVDDRVRHINSKQQLLQQTNFNYNQISQLFKEEIFIPFSAWAISPNTILHVLNDITINKRKSVIEFGAGASTIYIAKLIETLELDTTFYSVESNQDWVKELERQLKLLKIDNFVKIIYAPIAAVPKKLGYQEQETWYDCNILKSGLKEVANFDLILVDGPVGAGTRYSRYTAIPFLYDKISPEFSIFLDDINRHDEKNIALEWQRLLDCKLFYKERYGWLSTSSTFDVTPFQIG